MGDLETLAKARRELEDLYLGVPDDSVNLTFEDLFEVPLTKFPSLDFSKAFENTLIENHHHHHINNHNFHHGPQNHVMEENAMLHGHSGHHRAMLHGLSGHHHAMDGHGHSGYHHHRAILMDGHHNYRRRRAGIPHSNICTFCNTYIYLFRHRCLVRITLSSLPMKPHSNLIKYVEECIVGSALALAWERCQKVENVLNAWAKDLVKGFNPLNFT
ncbi:hypothetical protein RND71_009691 [Anisodus tanguticus]|uniref:Uncharacterized protein n=1 Tax=Anisodus tanguticus TaxID=243964 RepID=A0AAE1SIB0_9SOLA|nr:hypothetical protein RND71_009691 [Anisodus tanguticus]